MFQNILKLPANQQKLQNMRSSRDIKEINNIFQPWVSAIKIQSQKKQNQAALFNFLVQAFSNQTQVQQNFHEQFIYGKSLTLYRKEKFKNVNLYIDQTYENLLWISTKTKAFVIDLSYTDVSMHWPKNIQIPKGKKCMLLSHFDDVFPFVFQDQKSSELISKENQQMKHLVQLFEKYIRWCKVHYSYPVFFSQILRMYAIEGTKSVTSHTGIEVLEITKNLKLGCGDDKKLHEQILQSCLAIRNPQAKKIKLKQVIDREALDDYFKIIFCSRGLEQVYELYARQKIVKHSDKLKPMLDRQQFLKFLQSQQHEPQLIDQILTATPKQLSFFDFCSFLQNYDFNYVCKPPKVNQDLPLNEYFCHSSHNTYLTGNQLTSDSKVQRYIQDLLTGVKCVELDVHNQGKIPVITHAFKDKTLCSKIKFEDTIKAINQFSEKNQQHYPIILSIENHANQDNKIVMIDIMTKVFKQKLYCFGQYKEKMFPTLKQLRGKIIVKTQSKIHEITNLQSEAEKKNQSDKEKAFKIIAKMCQLTSIFKAPDGIKTENSGPYECTSMVNKKVEQKLQNDYQGLTKYTKRSWLRTYPAGTQIDSSNYDPCPMIAAGAQIVALNTQTKDQYATLMMSYFKSGRQTNPANIGYVEKPKHLQSFSKQPKAQMIKQQITLKLVERYNQKVKLKFYGMSNDNKINKDASFRFIITNPYESFIIVEIDQNWKDCIPVRFIKAGYRIVIARNNDFVDSGRRLILHVDIR